MKTLKEQINFLHDQKRQAEIIGYRYYTRKNQIIIIELLLEEFKSWPENKPIPDYIYHSLLNIDQYCTSDIFELCLLYRKVILEIIKTQEN